MKKHFLKAILLGLIVIPLFSMAQKENEKARFHSIWQAGIVSGESSVAASAQAVNGIGYKSWFWGLGVGIDCYKYRSVPIFADVRKEFKTGRNYIFIYGDLGYHIPWVNDSDKTEWVWEGSSTNEFKGGVYWDGGLGYSINFRHHHAILLSGGYSYKQMQRINTSSYLYSPGDPFVQTRNYYFNRLIFKVGWKF